MAIMRRFAIVFCAIALASTVGAADDLTDQRSFKGWELYAWRDRGDWTFSLLFGTNRIKFCDEVKNPKGALDLAQAEAALDRLAQFEWVSLRPLAELEGRCGLAPPPADAMARLQRACARRALHCEEPSDAVDVAPKD
jgi:hypothetical protein